MDRLRETTPDVEMCLDFPVTCLLSDARFTQTSRFPLELIDLLARHRIELELTLYPECEEENEEEDLIGDH